uniref:Uncharacterized protein n=1 Tax=Chromera velia CCMP2878 TaxID=1169474 RepID=A0A0G4GL82_9ALVE|eukprot:Cvel_4855.t1-p1 / transcript=Cvel_4855.t1 / gene=Cvel_4855 / organism=Chromera_velia_CCMP2878 / gene_product=hypothetical protein / transcript_product=hypothetical protein / location=Cvel_scaffold219:12374-28522(-) / protein_length=1462 / sequence_SO=supercontig / SO=protein_coding / is_pseudo=false
MKLIRLAPALAAALIQEGTRAEVASASPEVVAAPHVADPSKGSSGDGAGDAMTDVTQVQKEAASPSPAPPISFEQEMEEEMEEDKRSASTEHAMHYDWFWSDLGQSCSLTCKVMTGDYTSACNEEMQDDIKTQTRFQEALEKANKNINATLLPDLAQFPPKCKQYRAAADDFDPSFYEGDCIFLNTKVSLCETQSTDTHHRLCACRYRTSSENKREKTKTDKIAGQRVDGGEQKEVEWKAVEKFDVTNENMMLKYTTQTRWHWAGYLESCDATCKNFPFYRCDASEISKINSAGLMKEAASQANAVAEGEGKNVTVCNEYRAGKESYDPATYLEACFFNIKRATDCSLAVAPPDTRLCACSQLLDTNGIPVQYDSILDAVFTSTLNWLAHLADWAFFYDFQNKGDGIPNVPFLDAHVSRQAPPEFQNCGDWMGACCTGVRRCKTDDLVCDTSRRGKPTCEKCGKTWYKPCKKTACTEGSMSEAKEEGAQGEMCVGLIPVSGFSNLPGWRINGETAQPVKTVANGKDPALPGTICDSMPECHAFDTDGNLWPVLQQANFVRGCTPGVYGPGCGIYTKYVSPWGLMSKVPATRRPGGIGMPSKEQEGMGGPGSTSSDDNAMHNEKTDMVKNAIGGGGGGGGDVPEGPNKQPPGPGAGPTAAKISDSVPMEWLKFACLPGCPAETISFEYADTGGKRIASIPLSDGVHLRSAVEDYCEKVRFCLPQREALIHSLEHVLHSQGRQVITDAKKDFKAIQIGCAPGGEKPSPRWLTIARPQTSGVPCTSHTDLRELGSSQYDLIFGLIPNPLETPPFDFAEVSRVLRDCGRIEIFWETEGGYRQSRGEVALRWRNAGLRNRRTLSAASFRLTQGVQKGGVTWAVVGITAQKQTAGVKCRKPTQSAVSPTPRAPAGPSQVSQSESSRRTGSMGSVCDANCTDGGRFSDWGQRSASQSWRLSETGGGASSRIGEQMGEGGEVGWTVGKQTRDAGQRGAGKRELTSEVSCVGGLGYVEEDILPLSTGLDRSFDSGPRGGWQGRSCVFRNVCWRQADEQLVLFAGDPNSSSLVLDLNDELLAEEYVVGDPIPLGETPPLVGMGVYSRPFAKPYGHHGTPPAPSPVLRTVVESGHMPVPPSTDSESRVKGSAFVFERDTAILFEPVWGFNWGHLFADTFIPAVLLLQRLGFTVDPDKQVLVSLQHDEARMEREAHKAWPYLRSALTSRNATSFESYGGDMVCFRELLSGKVPFHFSRSQGTGGAVEEFRRLLLSASNIPVGNSHLKEHLVVFYGKEVSGATYDNGMGVAPRAIMNLRSVFAAVSESLERVGVRFLALTSADVSSMSFEEQLSLFANTTVLISPGGAFSFAASFLPPGAVTLLLNVISPNFRSVPIRRDQGFFSELPHVQTSYYRASPQEYIVPKGAEDCFLAAKAETECTGMYMLNEGRMVRAIMHMLRSAARRLEHIPAPNW